KRPRRRSRGSDQRPGRRCGLELRIEMLEVAVAARFSLPQRRHARLALRVRPQRQPVPLQVLLGGSERVEVLWRRWAEPHLFRTGSFLSSHGTPLPIADPWAAVMLYSLRDAYLAADTG